MMSWRCGRVVCVLASVCWRVCRRVLASVWVGGGVLHFVLRRTYEDVMVTILINFTYRVTA